MAGAYNSHSPAGAEGLTNDRFTACAAVPYADPLRPWFGSDAISVVLNFVDGIALVGNRTTAHPAGTEKGPAKPALLASIRNFPTSLPRYFGLLAIAAFGVAHPSAGHIILHAPQALPKPLRQLMPRTPQPCF